MRSFRLCSGDFCQVDEEPEIQEDIEALLSTCLDARRRQNRSQMSGGGASSSRVATRFPGGGSSRPLPRMPSLDSGMFSLSRESNSVMPQQPYQESYRLHYDAAPTHMLGHSASARNLHAHLGASNVSNNAAATAAFQRQQLSVLHETRQASREGGSGRGSREKVASREKLSIREKRDVDYSSIPRNAVLRSPARTQEHVQMVNEGESMIFSEDGQGYCPELQIRKDSSAG